MIEVWQELSAYDLAMVGNEKDAKVDRNGRDVGEIWMRVALGIGQ